MNKKWSEKTTFEKTLDIVSFVACAVWLTIVILKRTNIFKQYADLCECICIVVICACQAISFWNVKRYLSYIAIAGCGCMVISCVLLWL